MAALSHTITLRFDCSAATRLLAELRDAPLEVREAFLSAFESGEQLFLLKSDDLLTGGTAEMVVRLEPADCLLRLLPATGAGD